MHISLTAYSFLIVLFSVMAVNNGCRHIKNLEESNFLCKYVVKGRFGLGTDTHMLDGKVLGRFTYCKYSITIFKLIMF